MKAAICTQCGAPIQVDENKDAGICPNCGTAFVTEKVINNYISQHTTVNNITQNITKNIYGGESNDADEYKTRGLTFIKLNDWI